MKLSRAFEHITITTGATRMSPRSEVDDETIAMIRAALARDGVMGETGWRVHLLETPPGGRAFDLAYRGSLVVRCWLCTDRSASDAMWEAASAVVPDEHVRLARPRGSPWLAASLLPGSVALLIKSRGALMEAGDLERCVAWALLEDRHGA